MAEKLRAAFEGEDEGISALSVAKDEAFAAEPPLSRGFERFGDLALRIGDPAARRSDQPAIRQDQRNVQRS